MKNIILNIKENYKLVIGIFIVGLLFGWIFFHSSSEAILTTQEVEGHEGHNHETENQVWTCSMHPQIKQDKPGLCPICAMDLIPLTTLTSSENDVHPNEIAMSESAAKLASIQTMLVSKGVPHKTVYLQGKIQADERNIALITARFGGRIEKLFVNFTGQQVKKGEKLATIYSPELLTAQKELLEAISFKESRPSIYIASKAKLKLWDLNDDQISAIEEKGEPQVYFDILSPISGTVNMRHVSIGDYVKEGNPLFKVIDLTNVWVEFDAYESDLPWIKIGDKIEYTVQALPGKIFSSKVTFIDPFINAQTRITSVRLELENKGLNLKPEMFIAGVLDAQIDGGNNQILIPKSALLWTGKRSVVYVKVPDRESPTFLYREIVLGAEAGAFYVVTEGLEAGEEIAVNGVFKIDAASQLQGLPSMMNPDGGIVNTGHNHGGSAKGKQEITEIIPLEKMVTTSFSKEVSIDFKKQLNTLVMSYLKMKDGFVATDEKQVEKEAKNVLIAFNKIDKKLLKMDASMEWETIATLLESNVNGIITMKGIEMKRSHFSIVSNKIAEAIDKFGINAEEPIYLEFCPMAFDDKGAYWISDSKEIRNPYFGDKMLTCGVVKKEY